MFVPTMTEQERATEQLQSELADACGALNAAAARVIELLGRALATEAWSQYGIHSPSYWAAWQCGLSPSRARQWMAMARRLPTLPVTEAAFAAGALSVDQVGAIVRHCPDHAEAEVAEFAKAATVTQLSRTLGHYTWVDEDDRPVEQPEAAKPEPREVDFGPDEDGNWRLRAQLPADDGALVEKALGLSRDRALADADAGERVTWADALVGMAESSIASPRPRPERFRHTVLWHLEDRTVQSHLGPAAPDWLGRLCTCDAEVVPVHDRAGLPVSVGRAQRTVPDRTRVLVEHRDGGCRVPGCDRRRWLQVHHIRHWRDGGTTDTANLVCLCATHHRLHHRGGLGISGNADDPDGLHFTDHHGRTIPACGRPRPPTRPPPPTEPYVHPFGERLDRRWVWFSPPPASPN